MFDSYAGITRIRFMGWSKSSQPSDSTPCFFLYYYIEFDSICQEKSESEIPHSAVHVVEVFKNLFPNRLVGHALRFLFNDFQGQLVGFGAGVILCVLLQSHQRIGMAAVANLSGFD